MQCHPRGNPPTQAAERVHCAAWPARGATYRWQQQRLLPRPQPAAQLGHLCRAVALPELPFQRVGATDSGEGEAHNCWAARVGAGASHPHVLPLLLWAVQVACRRQWHCQPV